MYEFGKCEWGPDTTTSEANQGVGSANVQQILVIGLLAVHSPRVASCGVHALS